MDFWEALQKQLDKCGFFPMEGREPMLYWRMENPIFYLIYFLDKSDSAYARKEEIFTAYAQEMRERLDEVRCTRLIALSVVVDNLGVDRPVDNVDKVENPNDAGNFYSAEDSLFRLYWDFSPQKGVTAAAGQPDRLIGIEKLLDAAVRGEVPEELPLQKTAEGFPVVTAAIFAVLLLLTAWTMLSGRKSEIFAAYGLSRQGILSGEYYRFLTCMFLHTGLMHLLSNGLYLYYFGARAELLLGRARYLLLYFVSGLCGGLFSIALGNSLSVGASGAIFGLIGAMLLLTRKRGASVTGINYSTMLLLVVFMLGFGFLDPNVDNLAHIGGMVGGCAAFWLMMRKKGRMQAKT